MIDIICILSVLVLVLLYLIVSLILCFVLHKRLFLHRERDSDGVYVRYEERKDKLERKHCLLLPKENQWIYLFFKRKREF